MTSTASQSATAQILASGVSVSYDGTNPVLEAVDFDARGGELVVLLGPNGGGKTTLFWALSGDVHLIDGTLESQGKIAFLPQTDRTRLDFPLTAFDVALMGSLANGRWWRRPSRADRSRAHGALEMVGLTERAHSLYGELSGGQRRRALIARTLVLDASIIALDEPLAGVDPASAQVISRVLESLRDSGKLVLVTSHDIDQARTADRVLLLNKRQIAYGPPATALTEAALLATYEAELTVIGEHDGQRTVTTVSHHDHEH